MNAIICLFLTFICPQPPKLDTPPSPPDHAEVMQSAKSDEGDARGTKTLMYFPVLTLKGDWLVVMARFSKGDAVTITDKLGFKFQERLQCASVVCKGTWTARATKYGYEEIIFTGPFHTEHDFTLLEMYPGRIEYLPKSGAVEP